MSLVVCGGVGADFELIDSVYLEAELGGASYSKNTTKTYPLTSWTIFSSTTCFGYVLSNYFLLITFPISQILLFTNISNLPIFQMFSLNNFIVSTFFAPITLRPPITIFRISHLNNINKSTNHLPSPIAKPQPSLTAPPRPQAQAHPLP